MKFHLAFTRTPGPIVAAVARELIVTAPDQAMIRTKDGLVLMGQFKRIHQLAEAWLVQFNQESPTVMVRFGHQVGSAEKLSYEKCFDYIKEHLEDSQIYFGRSECLAMKDGNAENAFGSTSLTKEKPVVKSER